MSKNEKVYINLIRTDLIKVDYSINLENKGINKTIDEVSINNVTETNFDMIFSRSVIMEDLFTVNVTLKSQFKYEKIDKNVNSEKYLNSKIEDIIEYTPMIDIAIMIIAQLSSVNYFRPYISNMKVIK